MGLSDLEYAVLSWTVHDYEAIHTIRDNVATDINRKISDMELGQVLLGLHSRDLLESYVYDDKTQQYIASPPKGNELSSVWWLTSEQGKEIANSGD